MKDKECYMCEEDCEYNKEYLTFTLKNLVELNLCEKCNTEINMKRLIEYDIEVSRYKKWTKVDYDEGFRIVKEAWDGYGSKTYKKLRLIDKRNKKDGKDKKAKSETYGKVVIEIKFKDQYFYNWNTYFPSIPNKKFFEVFDRNYKQRLESLNKWKNVADSLK